MFVYFPYVYFNSIHFSDKFYFYISRKTDHKQLRLLIMFPDEYPKNSLMVEVKSKSLPERVMTLIENIAEKEAKKLLGQFQVYVVIEFNTVISCQ